MAILRRVPIWARWATIVLALAALVTFGEIPPAVLPFNVGEECQQKEAADNENCSAYSVAWIALARVFNFLDSHGTAVSALATLAIASFTATLWWSTRRLWLTSNRSANAAVKAAEAAAQSARAERAWITLDGFDQGTPGITIDDVYYEKGFIVVLRWKNTGRSPAVRVDLYVDHRVIPADERTPYFESPPPEEERHAIVGPGAVCKTNVRGVAWETFERVKSGELKWFIYSKATYGTTLELKDDKTSEACVLVVCDGNRIENGEIIPNVSFSFIGPQNTAT